MGARLLSGIEDQWGQIVMNTHLSPLVDHLLKRVSCMVSSFLRREQRNFWKLLSFLLTRCRFFWPHLSPSC
jgi:hypothetical protein